MVIIRNRLIALLSRLFMLGGLIVTFVLYFLEMSPAWRALCFFEVQCGIAYMVFLAFEVVFNAIDMRRGVKGIAAGGNASMMLLLSGYCVMAGILYFSYIAPIHNYLTLRSIFFNALLILIPLLNWTLFEGKGTVRYYFAFIGVSYPLIYGIFSIFRAVIWPNDPLYTPSKDYIYHFLDPRNSVFPWAIFVSMAAVIVFFLLLIFINNLYARKYRKRVPYLY